MKKKRFSEEQMVSILREADTGDKTIVELCRAHGISDVTFYAWRRKFGQMSETAVRRLRELEKDNVRLKRLLAERDLEVDVLKEFLQKRVATVPERRQAVGFLVQRKISRRRACDLTGVSRRWLAYQAKGEDMALVRLLCGMARRYPRYGYRMLHQLAQRQWMRNGRQEKLNVKRIRRLCRQYGLTLPHRASRTRCGQGVRIPCQAQYPNHVWAYDFVFDALEDGRKLKILTVEDEYTRQALAVEAGRSMKASAVAQTILRLMRRYGRPRFVRSDNGPEFIAKALVRRLEQAGITIRHIDPGSPWQNGTNERFNGSLRRECLDLETFGSLSHAQAICRMCRQEYNRRRPHSSLGYQTPDEFAARAAGAVSSTRPRTPTRPCNSLPYGCRSGSRERPKRIACGQG